MKSLSMAALALACLLGAVSCIKDDLDPCPPEGGGVEVTLYAQKFQTRPPFAPSDLEENFAARIRSLDYFLYSESGLIERGSAADVSGVAGRAYILRHATLPFGKYRLVLRANTSEEMMSGSAADPQQYYIVYQGEGAGDDHFVADLNFEVTCPCSNEFEAVLQRVHGVTRFRFENVPPQVGAIEVSLDGVGARTPVSGLPDRARAVTKRVELGQAAKRDAVSLTLGTFATLPGGRASWRMKLYGADGREPLLEKLVTDTLRIEPNQLLDLKTRFKDGDLSGEIEYRVDVDTSWDGSNDGGGEIASLRRD